MDGCLCKTCASETCWNAGHDTYIEKCSMYSRKPATNYDLLIRKTPEEMAAWLADHPLVSEYDENNPKHKAWLEWLKEEGE